MEERVLANGCREGPHENLLDRQASDGLAWERCPFARLSPEEYIQCAALELNSSFPLWDLEYNGIAELLGRAPGWARRTLAHLFEFYTDQDGDLRDVAIFLLLVRLPSIRPGDFAERKAAGQEDESAAVDASVDEDEGLSDDDLPF